MKTCFKCGVCQPLSEFYRHERMADGHLNKCKACTKKDTFERRHGNGREKVLAYEMARSSRHERVELRKKTTKEWVERNPRERKCQNDVANAVRSGRLFKWPACAVPECESTRPVAHHPDYGQPLQVVWLCQAHHKQAHALTDRIEAESATR